MEYTRESMTIPKELQGILVSDADTLGGSVRFAGTRVPLRCLLDAITCGRSLDYFLESYPGVTKDQALAVLKWEQNKARETFGMEIAL